MKEQVQITTPTDILPLVSKWGKRREENFLAISLTGAHIVIRVHHVTKGLLNKTIVHPRECFFPIIRDYAASVLFVHNHPSGNEKPSSEDDDITSRLCMAGNILGIHILDHIIITPQNKYFSYQEYGKLKYEFLDYEKHSFINTLTAESKL